MDIEERVNQILEDVPTVLGVEQTEFRGERQILIVESATYFSAGYRPSDADPTPLSQAYIELRGTPSPSSDVTRGYIRFVPANQIRKPQYSAKNKLINLWVDQQSISLTLEQMNHSQRWLWFGEFAGGHIYSDLHSIP